MLWDLGKAAPCPSSASPAQVRLTVTLYLWLRRYSIFILAVEAIGVSALLPYALLLCRSVLPKRGNPGLPAAKGARPGTPMYP